MKPIKMLNWIFPAERLEVDFCTAVRQSTTGICYSFSIVVGEVYFFSLIAYGLGGGFVSEAVVVWHFLIIVCFASYGFSVPIAFGRRRLFQRFLETAFGRTFLSMQVGHLCHVGLAIFGRGGPISVVEGLLLVYGVLIGPILLSWELGAWVGILLCQEQMLIGIQQLGGNFRRLSL